MDSFSYYLDKMSEIGIVDRVNHPIAYVKGIPLAKLSEIVVFETGERGEVFSIERDFTEILVFSQDPVRVGSKLTRTGRSLSVKVGKELLGAVIDPLGNIIFKPKNFQEPTQEREIDNKPLGLEHRKRIKRPLKTGTALVDIMIPIGKGQRELVIGDRKTGKSSFLLTTVKNQVHEGSIVVYAAIAKKKTDVKRLEKFFRKERIFSKIVIVAANSNDSPSLIYLTPYTAMTIAEYFRDNGQDVLLLLDDLSSHAKFYRELSLLAGQFPGRDSYPGDIFYTHSRLLERAGNFQHPEKQEAAITCFPVAETVEGDFTGYIATNLMGMTDGHIFFDSNLFYKGRRPGINISLSVSRVGRQTQRTVKQNINRELNSFFNLFDKMQSLSHFGAELTTSVKRILTVGERIYKFFDQPYTIPISEEAQLIFFSLIWLQFIEEDDSRLINEMKMNLIESLKKKETKNFVTKLLEADTFNDLLFNVSKNKERLIGLCKNKN